jgi:hypothetical protein
MRLTQATLEEMLACDTFVATYSGYVGESLKLARYSPQLSYPRVHEAHGAWAEDLQRVLHFNPKIEELDHFKRCGHLAFWLRRMAPLIDVTDNTKNLADAEGYPLTDFERAFRKLLFGYANEYLAFDFAFQICKFYESHKIGASARATSLALSTEYYVSMCQFLKYKTVSPHAMYAIYKSLFA